MSYQSKLDFIRDTVTDLEQSVDFSHGSTTDIEEKQPKSRFIFWVLPFVKIYIRSENTTNIVDQTTLNIYVLKQSKTDMTLEEQEKALDETTKITDEFVRLMNYNHKNDARRLASQDVQFISAVTNDPFLKELSHILTGIHLTYTLNFSDEFDYCSEC